MAYVAAVEKTIVLGIGGIEPTSAARWLSPILIGISAPAIIAVLFFHDVVQTGEPLILGIMGTLMALSLAAYIFTVLFPGDAIRLKMLHSERAIEVLVAGPFAVSRRKIPYAEIASLQSSTRYDDDGYSETVAILTMVSGKTVTVPLLQSMDEFNFARKALTQSTARR